MEIELYDKMNNPLDAISQIGAMFARSGMFGCTNDAQGQILALACIAEKKSPIQIKRKYHIIDGNLTDRADSMLGEFIGKGGKHKVLARSADSVSVELTRDGQSVTFSLTWEEVQKEPFVYANNGKFKKNYATPRARMQTMWARVISDGVRTMAPDIVAGVVTPEELDDMKDGGNAPQVFAEPAKAAAPAQTAAPAPEPEKAPRKKKEAPPVVEAEVVKTEPAKPAEEKKQDDSNAELAPTKQAAPAPAPDPAVPTGPFTAITDPNTGRLTKETTAVLMDRIGEKHLDAAIKWMVGKGWIKADQGIFNVSAERAQKVINNPTGFLKQLGV